MKISFVIPAHNEEKNIAECVFSIQKEITRTKCDAEIIVVNNASTDATKDIALSCGAVIVVDEDRKGIVFARQAGYQACAGDLVANIDADNRLPLGWLDEVFRVFADTKVFALSGPLIYYDLSLPMRAATRIFFVVGYLINMINSMFGVGSLLQGGNFILRREAIEKIGGYDTSIHFYGEDTDIGKRVSRVGKVVFSFKLPIYSSGRRIREEGLVRTGTKYALNFFSVTYMKKPITKEYSDIRT